MNEDIAFAIYVEALESRYRTENWSDLEVWMYCGELRDAK